MKKHNLFLLIDFYTFCFWNSEPHKNKCYRINNKYKTDPGDYAPGDFLHHFPASPLCLFAGRARRTAPFLMHPQHKIKRSANQCQPHILEFSVHMLVF